MLTYLLRRLLSSLSTLLGVVTLTFFALRLLPGDPATMLVSQGGGTAEQIAALQSQLGLDAPLIVQYMHFLNGLLRGDLGQSLVTHRPVAEVIAEQIFHTVSLAVTATSLAVLLGILLGTLAAANQGTWVDRLCMALAVIGVSIPILLSGLLLMLLFSLTLGWLPATGQGSWRHLIMPALALNLAFTGTIARLVRAQLAEVLAQEYIVVARAKGLHEITILVRHALRNALIPVTTVIGLRFGSLLGGTVVVETLFSRRGLGRLLVDAILWKDYPLVQGLVMLSAALYLTTNLAVDLGYGLLNPRIHHE